ncbi:LOW QUALITY PROTEIN: kinesin-like protein KIN-14B [Salvia hispanica]|uniref:LOW QUALITY PROTEIN: kinesin-like protein KIN-14B n=1 Tax=Salvia hispanica TaxID=49212 RepID=UPI002009C399|nr:LOW QUALITY PROTEIN: kinesin-like protein KIN-14B [Salvia hispanica]
MSNNRWNWEVAGFEPKKSVEQSQRDDYRRVPRRYSTSISSQSDLANQVVISKLLRLNDKLKVTILNLVSVGYILIDVQHTVLHTDDHLKMIYISSDQAALETEARIFPLLSEKKKLFNDLLTAKGNVKVFCRVRPLFEEEGPDIVEFPDDNTLRINTEDESLSNPKKDFEFDRVYGPHVGQADLFADIQPFVQSAFDGFNVSLFSYGQTSSGKTHTMEGSSHDRGLYARSFEELFDLSNSDATSTSRYSFSVSVFELYNEQITDLLLECGSTQPKVYVGSLNYVLELVQEKVENPLEFNRILKTAFQNRGTDTLKFKVSHLIVFIHIYHKNLITGENTYSKLSLVDLAGSESTGVEDETGERATELLHVLKSLSALGDVLASLTSMKDDIPYENSMLTKVLADSLGGSSITLMIVNICPNVPNMSETLSSLNFSSRARNAMLSLGNRDTIKNWKDIANDARKELLEKEKEASELKLESMGLKQDLKLANDQCVLLFNEVQKAWKVSFTLQSDLKTENIMLADKFKVEKDQNLQLRNQVTQFLQVEQEQKLQIEEKESAIQMLQAKLKNVESQLNEARETRTTNGSISQAEENSSSKDTGDDMDSAAVTKRLEDELKKRDALIEVFGFIIWQRLHEENEKLFERLTEKASSAGPPQVSSPSSKAPLSQSRDLQRNENANAKGHAGDGVSPLASEKTERAITLVKTGTDIVKTTPAGEYLTSALNDFDPEQYDSLAAISDGANKLLMLVLAAVIKAGASREHEILAEIRDAVFAFIRKMEPRRVMDTMLHKDIAGTLATEAAEDSAQVAKLRSALESVDHKRRKILQQMKNDAEMLSLESGAAPIRNPSTAAEDARLASLISLDSILKQVKDIMRQASVNALSKSKKRSMLVSLDELSEQMPSLLDIDHPCAQSHISEARDAVESTAEEDKLLEAPPPGTKFSADATLSSETDVAQWNVLQFNTGSTTPFIIKCGANSKSELVVKADARVQEPKGGEIVRVVPRPTVLEHMSLEEMKDVFAQLPEALSLLALARTGDGTRARYSRLYRTLAMKVPALRDLVGESYLT